PISPGMHSLGLGRLGPSRDRRGGVAVVLLASAALVASFVGTAGAQGAGHASTVNVTQRDFKFQSDKATVPARTVTFRVHNRGPSAREFNVARTTLPDGGLPLRADGLTANEDSPPLHRIDSLNDVSYQDTQELTVHLTPGHYVMYCNLEGHYLGGMHVSLTVR